MSLTTNRGRFLVLVNALTLGFAVVSLVKIILTTAPDFSVFYQSAVNLIHGVNVYHDQTLFTGLGYPPMTLLPFIPLTFMPFLWAQGVWVAGSLVMFFLSVALALKLIQRLTLYNFLLVFPFLFFSFPTRFTLGMGQVNFYALFFLLASVYLIKREFWWSGVCLIIALFLKPHLAIILPVFLLSGGWRVLLVSLGGYALTALITGYAFGWFQFISYVNEALPPLLAFRGREIYYNQNLASFFSRLALPWAQELTLVTSLGLFLLTLLILRQRKLRLTTTLGVFLPLFLLVEPLAWQHHFVFLIPSFIWLWPKLRRIELKGCLLLSYALVSLNIKNPLVLSQFWLSPLVLSHVFLGAAIIFILYLTLLWQKKLIIC